MNGQMRIMQVLNHRLPERKVFYAGQPCCNEWREIQLN